MRKGTEPIDATDIEPDLRRILAVQALRAFAYGFGTVILGESLATAGLSTVQVGWVLTAMLAGMAIAAVTVGLLGDRVGRRRLYLVLLSAMALAGVVFAITSNLTALIVVALTGTMSTDANESGPITTLEQAMIGRAPADARAQVFGRYNAIAYLGGALGALAAGGPEFVRQAIPSLPSDQRWLFVITVAATAAVAIAAGISPAVEERSREGEPHAPLRRSRTNVFKLSSLFAVDAFAGGFVVNAFIVLWFITKFDTSTKLMGTVMFAAGLLQAGSSIVAARLGARFGLLNTMVFSHLPSNLLLILVPLMPTLPLAIAVLLLRFALSQMDVPTRQAYIAAMVDPEERTAAAAFTNTSRYVARPFGPAIGTALMSNVAVAAPFVVAGALKSGYDLLLWRVFKRVQLPETPSGEP